MSGGSPASTKSVVALSTTKCHSSATQTMAVPWEGLEALNNQLATVLPSLQLDKSNALNIEVTCTPQEVKLRFSSDPTEKEIIQEEMFVDRHVECNIIEPTALGLFSVEYDGVAGFADMEDVGTQQN